MQIFSKSIIDHLFWLGASLLGTFLLMYQLMGKTLFNLGTVMHEQGGDGLKNYFTAAYQYKWGEGAWFDGMHYPYGDFAVYTDAQLSLVYLLKGLRFIGIDSENHLLWIVQGLPVLLLCFICFFIFKIGLYYNLPKWFAFVLGLLAIAYSPHLYKLTAHFGLSYGFLAPAYWYFLLKSKEQNAWKTFVFGILFLLFAAYLHPYWVLILALFSGVFFVFTYLIERDFRWQILGIGLLSIASFMLVNKSIDSIADRPDNPWGMHAYQTTAASLVSQEGFIHNGIKSSFKKNPSKEGLAYIGPLFYLCPLVLLLGLIFIKNRKNTFKEVFNLPSSMWISTLSALVMLLFAMGIHLDIFGDRLLELAPPLKQFRSIGRFSWIYFYVFIVFGGVIFYLVIDRFSFAPIKYFFFAALLGISGVEIYQYFEVVGQKFSSGTEDWLKSERKVMDLLEEAGKKVDDFQVLFTLPPSMEGAEKIGIKDRWSIRKQAMPFIYQSGLPSTLTVMSRTSIGQALKILQLGSGPYIEKELLKDLNSEKPFLTLCETKDTSTFKDILQSSKVIGYKDNICLFETPLSVFDQEVFTVIDSIFQQFPSIKQTNDSLLFSEQFDDQTSIGLLGEGSYYTEDKEYLAFDIPIETMDTTAIEMSFWVKIQAKKSEAIAFQLKALDSAGKKLWEDNRRDYQMGKFDIFQSWVRIYHPRSVHPEVKRLQLRIYNKYHYIDDILCTIKGYTPLLEKSEPYQMLGHQLVKVED